MRRQKLGKLDVFFVLVFIGVFSISSMALAGSLIAGKNNESAFESVPGAVVVKSMSIPSGTFTDTRDESLSNQTFLADEDYLIEGKVKVILSFASVSMRSVIVDKITSMGYEQSVIKTYDYLPFVSATLNYTDVFSPVLRDSRIMHVSLDRKAEACLDVSVPIIKPAAGWSQVETELGSSITGSGARIAVLDTGIDLTHPDFAGRINTVSDVRDFTGKGNVVDGHGHGTHCASIAAGAGSVYKGVAPGATLVIGKVLDDRGSGYVSNIIAGIQWAVLRDVDIISMSIGGIVTDGTDELSLAVDWAYEDCNVLMAIAAGNSYYPSTINSPGSAEGALTVGAIKDDLSMADFSSRGPVVTTRRIKPDVVAPGYEIIAARAAGTKMGSPVDAYYTSASGTSMATPHVAGLAALLKQAHPTWNAEMLKCVIISSATDLGLGVYNQGNGVVNAPAAALASVVFMRNNFEFGNYRYSTGIQTDTISIKNLKATQNQVTITTDSPTLPITFKVGGVAVTAPIVFAVNEEKTITIEINFDALAWGNHVVKILLDSNLDTISVSTNFIFSKEYRIEMTLDDAGYTDGIEGKGGYRFGIYNTDYSISELSPYSSAPSFNIFYVPAGTYTMYVIGMYTNLVFYIEETGVTVSSDLTPVLDLEDGTSTTIQLHVTNEGQDEDLSTIYEYFYVYEAVNPAAEPIQGNGFSAMVYMLANIRRDLSNPGFGSSDYRNLGDHTFVYTSNTHVIGFGGVFIPETESDATEGDQFNHPIWTTTNPEFGWASFAPPLSGLKNVENFYCLGWRFTGTSEMDFSLPTLASTWEFENMYSYYEPMVLKGIDGINGWIGPFPEAPDNTWYTGSALIWEPPTNDRLLPFGVFYTPFFITPNRDITIHFGTTGGTWDWLLMVPRFDFQFISGDYTQSRIIDMSRNYFRPVGLGITADGVNGFDLNLGIGNSQFPSSFNWIEQCHLGEFDFSFTLSDASSVIFTKTDDPELAMGTWGSSFGFTSFGSILGRSSWTDLLPGVYTLTHTLAPRSPYYAFSTATSTEYVFTYTDGTIDYTPPTIGDIDRPLTFHDQPFDLVLDIIEDQPITTSNIEAWWAPSGTQSWQVIPTAKISTTNNVDFTINCDFVTSIAASVDGIAFKFKITDTTGNYLEYSAENFVRRKWATGWSRLPLDTTSMDSIEIKAWYFTDFDETLGSSGEFVNPLPLQMVAGTLSVDLGSGNTFQVKALSNRQGVFTFVIPAAHKTAMQVAYAAENPIQIQLSVPGFSMIESISQSMDLYSPSFLEGSYSPVSPMYGQSITYSATVGDNSDISSVQLFHHVKGTSWPSTGEEMSLSEDLTNGALETVKKYTLSFTNTYNAEAEVEFKFRVVDDAAHIVWSASSSFVVSNTHIVPSAFSPFSRGYNSWSVQVFDTSDQGVTSGTVSTYLRGGQYSGWEQIISDATVSGDGYANIPFERTLDIAPGTYDVKLWYSGSGQYLPSEMETSVTFRKIETWNILVPYIEPAKALSDIPFSIFTNGRVAGDSTDYSIGVATVVAEVLDLTATDVLSTLNYDLNWECSIIRTLENGLFLLPGTYILRISIPETIYYPSFSSQYTFTIIKSGGFAISTKNFVGYRLSQSAIDFQLSSGTTYPVYSTIEFYCLTGSSWTKFAEAQPNDDGYVHFESGTCWGLPGGYHPIYFKMKGDSYYETAIYDATLSIGASGATDSDLDGLDDQSEQDHGTLTQNPDTDNDRVYDGAEVYLGLDPLSASSNIEQFIRYKSQITPHNWPFETTRFKLHTPVSITSPGEFTQANGVISGTGTIGSPFIIEGWIFTGEVAIRGTSVYFIIRNCIFKNLILSSISNGIVRSCFVSSKGEYGITVISSSYIEIANNTFKGGSIGVHTTGMSQSVIKNNIFQDNTVRCLVIYDMTFAMNTIFSNFFLMDNPVELWRSSGNTWDFDGYGNYWQDYLIKANSPYNNGITYTTRYPIGLTYSNQFDNFPLYASLPGYGQLTRHDAIFEQDSLTIDFHWSRPGHDGSSAATPVIIEGFFINAEGADFGVRFWSSTLYVLLRNCIIVNAKTGVEMWACQNIKVQNCLIVDHEVQGIFVSYSDYCTAEGNTLRNIGPYAIYVAESDFATITGNIIDMSYATSGTSAINIGNCNDPLISSNVIDLGAYVTVGISIGSYSSSTNTRIIGNSITSSNVYTIGIDIHDVPTVTIQKNIITGIGTGISMNGVTSPVGSASLIGGATEDLGNTISGNSIAMVIQYCTRITIAWNTFGNNDRAIFKYSSSGIVVENNNIITGTYSDGSYAISDPDGGNITITGNYIKGYETGIIINGVSNVSISNNTIDSCVVAIMCTGADLITIQENVLVNNTGYGVVIQANVTNATIAGNQFLNNNNGNVQASDDAGGNTWTGNYWSDFEARYPNATSTYGVWDVPYTLDGASNTTDATAIVNVGGVDETGEFLDTMEFMFDDLAASISTNLTGFKKWICLVLAYRAATIVQSMVEDHENGDPISVMDLALLTIITRVIQVIACKPGISAICNNITMAIANFAETNGIS